MLLSPIRRGTTIAIEDAEVVAFRTKDGETFRAEANTTADGNFSIKGVGPGVYSLTAHSDRYSCGLRVKRSEPRLGRWNQFSKHSSGHGKRHRSPNPKTAIIRYLPPDSDCAHSVPIDGTELEALFARACGHQTANIKELNRGMKVRLLKSGARGKDLPRATLTNAFIMKNGFEIAHTVTNDSGEFDLPSIDAPITL